MHSDLIITSHSQSAASLFSILLQIRPLGNSVVVVDGMMANDGYIHPILHWFNEMQVHSLKCQHFIQIAVEDQKLI